jgi:hypothetical protein
VKPHRPRVVGADAAEHPVIALGFGDGHVMEAL